MKQTQISLGPFDRGIHLITEPLTKTIKELNDSKQGPGLAHIFCMHTSCALSINESYDPSVRADLEQFFNRLVPENQSYYTHTMEGPDDLPAHIKTSLWQTQLTLPIKSGQLLIGTWQGIYLGEFRNRGGSRKFVITLQYE